MKAVLYTLLIIFVLCGVCIVTCPDREAHCAALKDLIGSAFSSTLSEDESVGEDADLVMLGSFIGTGLGGIVIDNVIKVENYFVCSIGTVTYDGETKIVSLGVLNHVFTVDEKDVIRIAKEIFN